MSARTDGIAAAGAPARVLTRAPGRRPFPPTPDAPPLALAAAEAIADRLDRAAWAGPDPYDGLMTPLAALVARGPRRRQALTQFVRRSPVNLRPLLGIRPRRMAAATGQGATAAGRLATVTGDPRWAERRDRLGRWTAAAQLPGGGWGYEVDVQTRWGAYPPGEANAVATAFAAEGCLDAGTLAGDGKAALARAILGEFGRDGWFAYTRSTGVLIHNASVLVAALAARLAGDGELDEAIRGRLRRAAGAAAATTVGRQRRDGAWRYGEGPGLGWVDGFHTAYVLLALDRLRADLDPGPPGIAAAVDRGTAFYLGRLFDGPVPRYYPAPRPDRLDLNNVATGLRAAVWAAGCGRAPWELPAWTGRYLLDLLVSGRGQDVGTAGGPWGTLGSGSACPRWSAVPVLDGLSAAVAARARVGQVRP